MDRKLFATLAVYTGMLGTLVLLYQIVAPFVVAIGWAAVITIVTFPLYQRLRAKLAGRQPLSASLMTAAVFLLLVVPVIGLTIVVVQELLRAQQLLDAAKVNGHVPGVADLLAYPPIARVLESLEGWAAQAGIDLRARMLQGAQTIVQFVLSTLLATVKNVAFFLFQLMLVLVAVFFLYQDGERFERWMWSLINVPSAIREKVRGTTGNMVSAVVVGVLVTAAAQGILGAIGFWICGLPSPVLFGVLMTATALVPVVGAALIWVPAVAYLLISGDTVYGIVLLVWGTLAISGVDNILRPVLISGRTGLPFALMLLGAIGGLLAFGLFGLVLGPLALALISHAGELREFVTRMPTPVRGVRTRARARPPAKS
jgi:predicted PurR-regulated permease PerM